MKIFFQSRLFCRFQRVEKASYSMIWSDKRQKHHFRFFWGRFEEDFQLEEFRKLKKEVWNQGRVFSWKIKQRAIKSFWSWINSSNFNSRRINAGLIKGWKSILFFMEIYLQKWRWLRFLIDCDRLIWASGQNFCSKFEEKIIEILTLAGKVANKLSTRISLKKLSEAKLKERREASRQNISKTDFWREASLRAFSFATLSHFWL